MSKRDELKKQLLESKVLHSMATVDFILEREKAILDQIEEPLRRQWNPLGDVRLSTFINDRMTEALSTIFKLRGEG